MAILRTQQHTKRKKTCWKQMGLQDQAKRNLQSQTLCTWIQPNPGNRFLGQLRSSNPRCNFSHRADKKVGGETVEQNNRCGNSFLIRRSRWGDLYGSSSGIRRSVSRQRHTRRMLPIGKGHVRVGSSSSSILEAIRKRIGGTRFPYIGKMNWEYALS